MMTSEHYINEVVGLPYVEGSCDPDIGLDCWGLMIDSFKRVDGIELPALEAYGELDLRNGLMEALNSGKWTRVDTPQEGAVVACFKVDKDGERVLDHVGRYFHGLVLHSAGKRYTKVGSVTTWSLRFMERRFDKVEFYVWR